MHIVYSTCVLGLGLCLLQTHTYIKEWVCFFYLWFLLNTQAHIQEAHSSFSAWIDPSENPSRLMSVCVYVWVAVIRQTYSKWVHACSKSKMCPLWLCTSSSWVICLYGWVCVCVCVHFGNERTYLYASFVRGPPLWIGVVVSLPALAPVITRSSGGPHRSPVEHRRRNVRSGTLILVPHLISHMQSCHSR